MLRIENLKFRAWSGTELHYSHEFQYLSEFFNRTALCKAGFQTQYSRWTGTKDKNGVEIYEGDVLSDAHPCKELPVVEFCEFSLAWVLNWRVSTAKSYLSSWNPSKLEVVGNIYQESCQQN